MPSSVSSDQKSLTYNFTDDEGQQQRRAQLLRKRRVRAFNLAIFRPLLYCKCKLHTITAINDSTSTYGTVTKLRLDAFLRSSGHLLSCTNVPDCVTQ